MDFDSKKIEKAQREIIAKAWADPKFKKRLIENPQAVLREYGFDPAKFPDVVVLENTPTKRYFILPLKPDDSISAEDLRKVSGGKGAMRPVGTASCCL